MIRNELSKLKEDIIFSDYLRGIKFTFHSTWGLFSPKSIDKGTKLLIEYLKVEEGNTCLDLGCGYGPIGMVMAKLSQSGTTCLLDKDCVGVEYATKNVTLNGLKNCSVILSNITDLHETGFDVVASNLPAKVSGEMLKIILYEAWERMNLDGRIYLVTISGLKEFIKRNLMDIFGNYKKVKQSSAYTLAKTVKRRELNNTNI